MDTFERYNIFFLIKADSYCIPYGEQVHVDIYSVFFCPGGREREEERGKTEPDRPCRVPLQPGRTRPEHGPDLWAHHCHILRHTGIPTTWKSTKINFKGQFQLKC